MNKEERKLYNHQYYEKRKEYYKQYQQEHKEQSCVSSRKWRSRNPEKVRAQNAKYRFGSTLDKYDEFFEKQNGVCAICGKVGKKLGLDHNHQTKEIRKPICHSCNAHVAWYETHRDVIKGYLNEL